MLCVFIQITHNKAGKIDGVVYVDKDGNQQTGGSCGGFTIS